MHSPILSRSASSPDETTYWAWKWFPDKVAYLLINIIFGNIIFLTIRCCSLYTGKSSNQTHIRLTLFSGVKLSEKYCLVSESCWFFFRIEWLRLMKSTAQMANSISTRNRLLAYLQISLKEFKSLLEDKKRNHKYANKDAKYVSQTVSMNSFRLGS